MEKEIIIAPSILSADFLNLKKEIKDVYEGGAKFLHFDVMDGHFVPNISFGAPILKCISKNKLLFNDVHLMIDNPQKYAIDFIKAGADLITFHYEAMHSNEEIIGFINFLKSNDVKAGLSIKPNTKVEQIKDFLPLIDLVLVMSVEPGFGGQKFNEIALDKIEELDIIRRQSGFKYLIEVDGGINKETGLLCKTKGVDVLVAGSYIYNKDNRKEAIDSLLGD